MHRILCTGFQFRRRHAWIARGPMFIGFPSNLSTSLYSRLSVRVLVSSDNPLGGALNSISSSRPHQLKRACISQVESETLCEPSSSVSQSVPHAAYGMACMQANRAPMSKQMFGRLVKQYRPDVREFQRTVNGTRRWMYGGIALRSENSNHLIGDGKSYPRQEGV